MVQVLNCEFSESFSIQEIMILKTKVINNQSTESGGNGKLDWEKSLYFIRE